MVRYFILFGIFHLYRYCVVFQIDHFTCFYLAKGHQTPRSTTRWYDHNDLNSLEVLPATAGVFSGVLRKECCSGLELMPVE